MPEATPAPQPAGDLEEIFQAYERDIRVKNYRTCVWLTIIFMLAGSSLDWIVYGMSGAERFFPLRLMSVAVLAGGAGLLFTEWGVRMHRLLGIAMAVPLIVSISWMIAITEGAESPYYAGLNLVLLGAAILMRWPLTDSIVVVGLSLVSYLIACHAHGPIKNWPVFYNNLYFLVVTGILTTAGTWVYNRIRFSEFQSRHDLDINRKQLEAANVKLEDNNHQLMKLDEAKSRFFANISHELRTPLTLLIAPLDALMNRKSAEAEGDKDTLAMMHANAMRLLKLINDLLDLVRMESGKVQVNAIPVNIAEFLEGQAAAVRQMAEGRQVAVTTSVDPELDCVMVDEEKLERICLNLLFNAIKFTPAGGRVELLARKKNDWLEVQVIDTGVGIASDQLQRVFDRFWQADTSSQRKQRGLGIGLALVKELVEAHGGTVSAASEFGKGAVMTVRLPLQIAPATGGSSPAEEKVPAPVGHQQWLAELYRRADLFAGKQAPRAEGEPSAAPEGDGTGLPVLLIAEDEADMRRFLKAQLSGAFRVLEAANGREAVEMALEHLPDIMLCDMMMPEKDGLQVCSEIRASTEGRSIPIVMLTAKADEPTKLTLLHAGATDFLAKPFSLTEVTVRLRNLARTRLSAKLLAEQNVQLERSMKQLKETEALLVRNEKLTSLGRLSAGLIHEINNPLHYAKQALFVLRRSARSMPEDERADMLEIVDDVEGGIDRVAAIISDLRGFTSRPSEENLHFKLKPALEMAMRFFSSIQKNGVGVEIDVPDTLELCGDRNHFLQVVINLVQNALDAVAGKDYARGEKPLINIRAVQEHDAAIIRIRDNGPGIDPGIMNQIFDPFFTTKDVGEGMGLGLAITHRIIAEHRGRISVNSEPGRFSEFIIELPLTPPAAAPISTSAT
jgi:signal transduction histidine kinase